MVIKRGAAYLIPRKQSRRAQQLGDAPEGLLFSGLSGGEVQRRDHVVVPEARVGACAEESLDRGYVPAQRRVVQRRPPHLRNTKNSSMEGQSVEGYGRT